jgi:hypothetical protein
MSGDSVSSSKSPTSRKTPSNVRYSPDALAVARLRRLQKTAIAACDIDVAEECAGEIRAFHEATFDSSFRELRSQLDESVMAVLEAHQQKLGALDADELSSILSHKRQINADFLRMRDRHVERLKQLQRDFASTRLRASQRIVPDAHWLVVQGQYAAQAGDFELARELLAQVAAVRRADHERNLAKTEIDLKAQTAVILQEQKRDMEIMVARLNRGLIGIRTEAQRHKDAEIEARDVRLTAEFQKITWKLLAIAPLGADMAPYQRELEELFVGRIEAIGPPLPQKLKNSPKTVNRQPVKSPRRI